MKAHPHIKSEVWYYPDAPGAFFTESEYTHHHFEPHFHSHYVFFCVAQGVNEGSFSKKKYCVSAEDFLIIHPGEIHSGNSMANRSLKYHTFCPTEKFLRTALENSGLQTLPSFPPVIRNAGAIIEKFNSLVNISAAPADAFFLEQSLTDLLGALIEKTGMATGMGDTRNVCRENIKRAKKFIEENYTDNFSLTELSRHAGLSTFHLLRSFKASIGITPQDYLNNFRVEMAKRKIGQKISLTQLAHYSGFYDQSHFIRHFKKINGITPSRFKQ
jgi:AraC-like DNA-binding protein